jgi:hypothetical protein
MLIMTTELGPKEKPNTILFVEETGHITNFIATDFVTYEDDAGPGNATEAQKQVYIYNRVIADPEGFGTMDLDVAALPIINALITPAIAQSMVAVIAGNNMQDSSGNNTPIEALNSDALKVLLGLSVIATGTVDAGKTIVAIAKHPNLTDTELPALTLAIQACAHHLDFEQYATILAAPIIQTNTKNARILIHKCGCIKPITCCLCGRGC